ncbi:MAG: hypothetical protein WAK60_11460 [Sedimentisphaerales bacterium]
MPPQTGEQKQKEEPAKEVVLKKAADVNAVAGAKAVSDVNAVAGVKAASDANAAADPNAVRAKIEKFEGLGDALKQIDMASSDEISRWTLSKEEKLDLALAVQKQITAELNFLRGLAVKEGAVKTTAAIDGILLDRQKRIKDVTEKLEKETERYRRLMEREEKKTKEREQRDRGKERTREHTDRNRKDAPQ